MLPSPVVLLNVPTGHSPASELFIPSIQNSPAGHTKFPPSLRPLHSAAVLYRASSTEAGAGPPPELSFKFPTATTPREPPIGPPTAIPPVCVPPKVPFNVRLHSLLPFQLYLFTNIPDPLAFCACSDELKYPTVYALPFSSTSTPIAQTVPPTIPSDHPHMLLPSAATFTMSALSPPPQTLLCPPLDPEPHIVLVHVPTSVLQDAPVTPGDVVAAAEKEADVLEA